MFRVKHKEKTFNDSPFILKLITMSKCRDKGPTKTKNFLFDLKEGFKI